METVWQDATISECAKICLQSFNDCLAQFHLLSPRQQSAVDDQMGRFSIWVSNIGAFAPTRGSLDYRLREAPDLQRLVRRLLRTLNDYIQQYLSQLDNIRPLSESTSESLESASDSLDSTVSGIAEEITLMHQLSNTIRKASRESQNVRAATSFKIVDGDGNDIGQWFLDLFALEIIQRRFPGCNEALQKRLAAAMLIRRKRILYRRSRYLTSRSKIHSAPETAIPCPSKDVTNQDQAPVPRKPEPAPAQRELSVASSRAVTATTLNLEHWKKASAPSVVSRAKTIHWSSHEELDFPPPPLGPIRRRLKALRERHVAAYEEQLKLLSTPLCRYITIYGRCPYEDKGCALNHDPHIIPFHGSGPVSSKEPDSISLLRRDLEEKIENDRIACKNGSMEVICPYCCCSLSSSMVTDKLKWIDHVKYDLDPYVCLFDDCDSPTELYNHSEDWLNHMRQHSLRWRCTARSHGVLVFDNRGAYEEHMSSKHKSTKSQLKILAERSSRSTGPLFQSCPLCGESSGTGLEEHVASHLRYLALKSLPFPDDDGYDNCSEELASEFQSSGGRTRSTMLEDNDPAESDHSLPPVQPSKASEQPHSPTSPRSSGWGFIDYAHSTDYDPSSDPILASFKVERSQHGQIGQAKTQNFPADSDPRYNLIYRLHLLRLRQDMATRLMEQYGPPTQYPPDVAKEYTIGLEQAAKDFVLDMMRRDSMEFASAQPSMADSMLTEDICDMIEAERPPPSPDFSSSNVPIPDKKLLSNALEALTETDVGYEDAAQSPVPRRVHFEEDTRSVPGNDSYKLPTGPTRRQSDCRVLCHACGRVWTSGQPLRLDCPHCFSDFTEIIMDPQRAEPPDPADVGNFNTLTDHAQSMSIETAGTNFESAPVALDLDKSAETSSTTDGELFARAVSKYREAFLEQHSHLTENERLQSWTQQLSHFIDGTSSPYGPVDSRRIYNNKSSSGKSRRPTSPDTARPRSGSEPPAERIAAEDTFRSKVSPLAYIGTLRRGPTETVSGLGHETYVNDLDAETVNRASTAATPSRAHRAEVPKRPRLEADAIKHADTVTKFLGVQQDDFSHRASTDESLVSSSSFEELEAAHGEDAQPEWASSRGREIAQPHESPSLGNAGEPYNRTHEDR
ncbi:hypothetical protein BDW66DRAFT_137161 [Aspergillus desertorum]